MWETNKKKKNTKRITLVHLCNGFFFLPSFSPLLCQQPLRRLLDVALEW